MLEIIVNIHLLSDAKRRKKYTERFLNLMNSYGLNFKVLLIIWIKYDFTFSLGHKSPISCKKLFS